MASITEISPTDRRIQFTDVDGKRKTIYFGKTARKALESILVHVEALLNAKLSSQPVRRETAVWLEELNPKIKGKLAKAELIQNEEPQANLTLRDFLEEYFQRPDVKASTKRTWGNTRLSLLKFFKPDRLLRSITPADAIDFERWLTTPASRTVRYDGVGTDKPLALNTRRKRCKVSRQFFAEAVERGYIPSNPFRKINGASTKNPERQKFVTREQTARLLEVCSNSQWRLLVALARYGALRCPSETHALTWGDIDWENERIRVPSPKTADIGRPFRLIPMFPELTPYLEAAFDECPEGETRCLWGIGDTNPGTHLRRLVVKAGLVRWPKILHQLRASRATELATEHPAHVATAWCGHSQEVAEKHYWTVTDADFKKALGKGEDNAKSNATPPENATQKATMQPSATSGHLPIDDLQPILEEGDRRKIAEICEHSNECKAGPAGIRTLNQGIMSPLL